MFNTISEALVMKNETRTYRDLLNEITECLTTAEGLKNHFVQHMESDPNYSFKVVRMKSVINSNIERIQTILDSFEKSYVFRKHEIFTKSSTPCLQATVCRARLAMVKRIFIKE